MVALARAISSDDSVSCAVHLTNWCAFVNKRLMILAAGPVNFNLRPDGESGIPT
jgi:hypothetical protein